MAFVYGLILLALWTPRPWQLLLWGILAAAMLAITRTAFAGLKPMGLYAENSANFFRPPWAIGIALAISVTAITLAAAFHALHLPDSPYVFVRHYGAYVLWAAIQQLGLQRFFLPRLLRLLPDGRSAAITAAVLFAGVHLPSPLLMLAALIWGLISCIFFLRYSNLYPLIMAHAILGIAIAVSVPAPVDHNMLVGLSYLTYEHQPAALSQP
jgi:hypothetical protein